MLFRSPHTFPVSRGTAKFQGRTLPVHDFLSGNTTGEDCRTTNRIVRWPCAQRKPTAAPLAISDVLRRKQEGTAHRTDFWYWTGWADNKGHFRTVRSCSG